MLSVENIFRIRGLNVSVPRDSERKRKFLQTPSTTLHASKSLSRCQKSTENKCSQVVGALSHPDDKEDDAEKNPGWREDKDDGENGLHCQADKQHDFSAISEEHTSTGDKRRGVRKDKEC